MSKLTKIITISLLGLGSLSISANVSTSTETPDARTLATQYNVSENWRASSFDVKSNEITKGFELYGPVAGSGASLLTLPINSAGIKLYKKQLEKLNQASRLLHDKKFTAWKERQSMGTELDHLYDKEPKLKEEEKLKKRKQNPCVVSTVLGLAATGAHLAAVEKPAADLKSNLEELNIPENSSTNQKEFAVAQKEGLGHVRSALTEKEQLHIIAMGLGYGTAATGLAEFVISRQPQCFVNMASGLITGVTDTVLMVKTSTNLNDLTAKETKINKILTDFETRTAK